jgi:hypothetical protein
VPWTTQRATVNGVERTYDVYLQESAESCGPACVMMVNAIKNGITIPETLAKVWFSKVENRAAPGALRGAARPSRVFNWRADSQADTILRVLIERKIGANQRMTEDARAVAACAPHMPGIARVQWATIGADGALSLGGGHFVVCLGPMPNNVWLYLDPTDGVVQVPRASPGYANNNNGVGFINRVILF